MGWTVGGFRTGGPGVGTLEGDTVGLRALAALSVLAALGVLVEPADGAPRDVEGCAGDVVPAVDGRDGATVDVHAARRIIAAVPTKVILRPGIASAQRRKEAERRNGGSEPVRDEVGKTG